MNGNGIEWLIKQMAENQQRWVLEQEVRRSYRDEHPTEFLILKCSDGRLVFAIWTKTLAGILQPLRNIGGRFEMGWLHFQLVLRSWKKYADKKGRHSAVIVTYHFASGSRFQGCAGHRYNDQVAYEFALGLKNDLDRYAEDELKLQSDTRLCPFLVGMDTRKQSLILHGDDDRRPIDLATIKDAREGEVINLLAGHYPKKWKQTRRVILDWVPPVKGNIEHTSEVEGQDSVAQNQDHRESILAVGRGFDNLNQLNTAIIVGPWELPNEVPIITAAQVITQNLERGVIEKPTIWTSAVYRDEGGDKFLAESKTHYLRKFTLETLKKHFPRFASEAQILSTTTNLDDRSLNVAYRSH